MPNTAAYIIYRDSPTAGAYHAVRADGTNIAMDATDPYPVLQTVLDQYFWDDPTSGPGPGVVYVDAADYPLQADFPGFDVRSYTTLRLDPTARLTVPNGYAGHVFRLRSTDTASVVHSTIDGGLVTEHGQPRHQWTAFLLDASASDNAGILFNSIGNTVIYDAQIGVRLWVSGVQDFINANRFEFLKMWHCERFISFQIDPPYIAGQQNYGIVSNTFVQLECQSDATLTVGVDALTGAYNSFYDVKIWDVPAGIPRTVITPQADNTRIFGGFMAGPGGFQDTGANTQLVAAT